MRTDCSAVGSVPSVQEDLMRPGMTAACRRRCPPLRGDHGVCRRRPLASLRFKDDVGPMALPTRWPVDDDG